MSNLINFDFQSQTVRVELKNGEPLFCLTDVATILEISRSSDLLQVAKDAFVKNETVKRGALDPNGVHKMYSVDSKGRKNEITFINEPNLYRVIFRSNKAEAVKFQNWVFDEVLPSIRKTGQYRHTISTEQQAQIQKAVRQKCQSNSTHYQTVYTALKDKFGVPSYKDILASEFDNAMAFIVGYEFSPTLALNIPFIQNVLADALYQNRKAQTELNGIRTIVKGLLHHLEDTQDHLARNERNVLALKQRFIA